MRLTDVGPRDGNHAPRSRSPNACQWITIHRRVGTTTEEGGIVGESIIAPYFCWQTHVVNGICRLNRIIWFVSLEAHCFLVSRRDKVHSLQSGTRSLPRNGGIGIPGRNWSNLAWRLTTPQREYRTPHTLDLSLTVFSGLSPEIAHFKKRGDQDDDTVDWWVAHPLATSFDWRPSRYIKGLEWV